MSEIERAARVFCDLQYGHGAFDMYEHHRNYWRLMVTASQLFLGEQDIRLDRPRDEKIAAALYQMQEVLTGEQITKMQAIITANGLKIIEA